MKKIACSFLFSIGFTWLVSAIFIDTIEPYEWHPGLKKYVRVAGTVNRERNEGWGSSVSGALGIHGIPDITKIQSRKIAIWGDSFVEAIQVDDDKKIAQVFTKISAENGLDLVAFGVGALGGAVVDYYFDLPKYERLNPTIAAHFILINHRRDVLPGKKRRGSLFVADPEFKFILKQREPQGPLFLRKLIYDLDLNFLFALAKSMPDLKDFRFAIGPVPQRIKAQGHSQKAYDEKAALRFLFEKLAAQTSLPIVFVYVPRVPELRDGRFDFTDPLAPFMKDFSKMAKTHGMGFISLEQWFIGFHQRTGRFHSGFINSKPGEGHLNEDGNRLVAEAIFNYISEENLH